jgi:hypothetical protein
VTLTDRKIDPEKGSLAYFAISNPSNFRIFFAVTEPQIRSQGVWSSRFSLPAPTELTPGQATNFSVPAPLEGDAWRLRVLWGKSATSWERLKGTVEKNFQSIRESGTLIGTRFGIEKDVWTNYSREMAR